MGKNVSEYRKDLMALLVKVDTRQEEIFHRINRIEKHLDYLNGKVADHEKRLTAVWSYGIAFVFCFSIVINLMMRWI